MILSAQSIRARCSGDRPMVAPFNDRTTFAGLSYGLGPAGYDVRLAQSVWLRSGGFTLGSTIERFDIPTDILIEIKDKSTWARRGLSVFNSTGEPGWRGYLTIEMVYHGPLQLFIAEGTPIAHIVFKRLDEPTEQPYVGKYQDQHAAPQAAIEEAA